MGMADVNPQSGYLPLLAYAQSNTANMLFTVQLAESLREKGICSFSAAPGPFLIAAFDPGLTSTFLAPERYVLR